MGGDALKSVGWIRFNIQTGEKAKGTKGRSFWLRNVSTKVYRSEATARAYCGENEVPKEVFIRV